MKKLLSFVAVAFLMLAVACTASKDEQLVKDCSDAQAKGDYETIKTLLPNFTESAEGYYYKATVNLILTTNPNASLEDNLGYYTKAKELYEKAIATDKEKIAAIEKKYADKAKPTADMIAGCQAQVEALQAQIDAANAPVEEPAEGEATEEATEGDEE